MIIRLMPLALIALVPACGEADRVAQGSPLSIAIAPLTLAGLTDACYDLTVTNGPNGQGDTVWQRSGVCTTQFGDGAGDVTYIGTCDAGPDGRVNSVSLALTDLWTAGDHLSAPGGYLDRSTYQNPCGSESNNDGAPACVLEVPCFENRDALVEFNLTLLRSANQGFFDIAVSFEDIFCSAKFDCGEPTMDLLFAADGQRHDTAVLAFACTAGPGGDATHLYMDDLVIACDGEVVATLDPSVDDPDDSGPGNQLAAPGGVEDPDADVLFQWAVYQGTESIGVNAQPPFDKAYWNVAVGFDVDDFAGRSCTLRTSATAAAGPLGDSNPGTTPAGTVYPRIVWDIALNGAGAAQLTCGSNALNASPGGPVRTDYVSTPTCFGNQASVGQSGFTSVSNSCSGGVTDCRIAGGPVCTAPLACDFLSGTCVDASLACTLNSTPIACGTQWRCGPGSTCDTQTDTCVATSQCLDVLCDATGACRGASCEFETGGISGVTVTVPSSLMAGAPNGVDATATVTAETLCGLNVTFEVIQDIALFTTIARGTDKLLRIPLATGVVEDYLSTPVPLGLAVDREGTLYWVSYGQVMTTRTDSGPPVASVFSATTSAIRLALGPDGLLYGVNYAGSLLVFDRDTGVETVVADGYGANHVGTGITFNAAGEILLATGRNDWSPTVTVNRYNRTTGLIEIYATWTFGFDIFIPYLEGMSLSPDGRVYAGFFPNQGPYGALVRIDETGPTPSIVTVLDVPQMQADVPSTRGAGVHGIAFGIDGSLYFANQNNTAGDDSPDSQILRLSGDPIGGPVGQVSLIAVVPPFDYVQGFDGDVIMQTRTVETGSASVNQFGVATIRLDAPTVPGVYAVRVLVSDPQQGTVHRSQKVFEVQ